jgi:predicted phage tail protein
VGGSFGAAVVTAILTGSALPGSTLPTEGAYTEAFALSAGAGLLAFGASRLIPPRPRGGRVSLGLSPP